jgi:hypothetical protein
LGVSHRPLVLLSGLTVGDYLLWNWSVGGNHLVLALVSGLTLVPLAGFCLLRLTLTLPRLLASSTRLAHELTARARERRASSSRARRRPRSHPRPRPRHAPSRAMPAGEPPTSTTSAGTSSSKLAA